MIIKYQRTNNIKLTNKKISIFLSQPEQLNTLTIVITNTLSTIQLKLNAELLILIICIQIKGHSNSS